MTNTDLLKDRILKSGFKVNFIAEDLGITRQLLWKKVNNKTPFNQYEIARLCKLLGITSLRDKERIFFAPDVD